MKEPDDKNTSPGGETETQASEQDDRAQSPSEQLDAPAQVTDQAQPTSNLERLKNLTKQSLGLPAKLLLLTAAFVMLAEILIFVPSVANFRITWMNDRLTAARLASLASEAANGGNVPRALQQELRTTARVQAVAVRRDGIRRLVLPPEQPVAISETFDLRPMPDGNLFMDIGQRLKLIGEALVVLLPSETRTIRIIGPLGSDPDNLIEVVVPERPLRDAIIHYGLNILLLSIFISLITAALVYVALSGLLVRPMLRISKNMLHFSDNPEDASRIIVPSDRTDEIGTTERELADMQGQLVNLIVQKNRLAQLGLAVSKINHDLRNMLASAQLLSDRLTAIPDPTVQRFTPKLIASLDRAINFCNDTLRFGRAEEATPRRAVFPLKPIVQEVADGLGLPRSGNPRPSQSGETAVDWTIDIPDNLSIDADPDHLLRVLSNLCRNALQILETSGPGPHVSKSENGGIDVRAWREGRRVTIEISDNGPGLPPKAREKLFRAFQGSQRKGGTGLGLAIAAELVAAHGGQLRLLDKPEAEGAAFEICLPDRLSM